MKLLHGDTIEQMKTLPDKSVDLILCDLPYGTTANRWDSIIPMTDYVMYKPKGKRKQRVFNKRDFYYQILVIELGDINTADALWASHNDGLWSIYNRVLKNTGTVLLFGSEPFSTYIRTSAPDLYKYDLYWQKQKPSNFQQMNFQAGKVIENIMIFSKMPAVFTHNNDSMVYNPITVPREHTRSGITKVYGKNSQHLNKNSLDKGIYRSYDEKLPINILKFNTESKRVHPTQKPVALLEYLVRTYSNVGDTVLDNTMGSGSTGVAALKNNRDFIGIELDDYFFKIAENRINSIQKETR